MTWRKLDDAAKAKVTNLKAAIDLMTTQTSVIKRPLIEVEGKVVAVGFDEAEYKKVVK